MQTPFELKEVDRKFYEERLRDFLPERIIDIHTHVWKGWPPGIAKVERPETWASAVAQESPIEELLKTCVALFPGKEVIPLIFGNVPTPKPDDNLDVVLASVNAYVADSARQHTLPALIYAAPGWKAEELERSVMAGGFIGLKVYLNLAPGHIPRKEVRIFDFLPHHQLEVANKHGWIVMLHIPRDGRLRDPLNLAQMVEIEERYPCVRLIIAHVGRAYCDEDVGDAFERLAGTRSMCFDFSGNTNQQVFEQLIDAVGSKRILYGSDLPILRMRARRIVENGDYVNIVPKGSLGDLSGFAHMREVEGEEAEALTFFLYEEIDAFRRAATSKRLSSADVANVFFNNAIRLLADANFVGRCPQNSQ